MVATAVPSVPRPVVAFGPEMPSWGSWDYLGHDLPFQGDAIPDCDVAIIVKHALLPERIHEASRRCRIIYLPVDYFDSCAAIDAYGLALSRCTRVIVHYRLLIHYFRPYTITEYLDHPVKYVSPSQPRRDGFVLWIGTRSNLEPLVEWVNRHTLPRELWLLTNFEDPSRPPTPESFGFRTGSVARMENWTADKHLDWTAAAGLALDIKGQDFRSRHKPPTKALEFLASGLPLAMNPDSSAADHLADMGFDLASPDDPERWRSEEYRDDTLKFAAAIRELHSLPRIARRMQRIIQHVLQERNRPAHAAG
jgi:hypothetical protein